MMILEESKTTIRELDFACLLPVIGLLAFLALLYARTANSIFDEWTGTGTYSHGLLAFVIIIYLFWLDRYKLIPADRIQWLPLVGLIGATTAWLLSQAANIWLIEIVALYGIFVCALALIYGIEIWLRCYLVLASLVLILPVWSFLQPILQALSAEVTHFALEQLDIPVFRESYLFAVPGGSFMIEPACSGLGFFLSSCLLAIIYTRVYDLQARSSLLLLAAAVGISILSNWLRIISIMVIGNMTNMEHPIVNDHVTFGWILFSVMLVPFMWIASRLIGHGVIESPKANLPLPRARRLLLACGLTALCPLFAFALDNREIVSGPDPTASRLIELLPPVNDQRQINWDLTFVNADDVDVYRTSISSGTLLVALVRYDYQEQGRELIYFDNSLFNSRRWMMTTLPSQNDFGGILLENPQGQTRVIRYTYLINGKTTSDPKLAKLNELVGYFLGHRTAYLIAIAAENPAEFSLAAMKETSSAIRDKVLN